jgi:hypothetical protein
MAPELHLRVRKLFDEALEKPESERLAFLENASGGDLEVRQAVESLLEAHGKSGAFLAADQNNDRRLGRYILSHELGRGSMGVVFEGIDPLIGRHVAVKVIRIDPQLDGGKPGFVREQFFREAQSAGKLLHPGIVVIFDVGQQGDAAFIAMELVEGFSLQDLLAANQRPPVDETLEILRQAAAALDYAHRNGIVHRDIKPANIMLHKGTTVKIADFGVAKISTLQNLTATGLILGTPTYMSPEQLEARPLDGRSDQFSLAVVAYEMLTGTRPFDAPSLAPLTHLVVYGERPSARAVNPALSEAADAALRKGLSKVHEERFETCMEFVAVLADALQESPHAAAIPVPVPVPMVAAPKPVPAEAPTPATALPPPTALPPLTAPAPAMAVTPPTARTLPAAPVLPAIQAPQPMALIPAPKPETAPATRTETIPLPAAPARKTPAVVWVLAALVVVAAVMVAGGLWAYRSLFFKSRTASNVAAISGASSPATSPAPPVAPLAASPAPAVARFSATPESLVAGNAAVLNWEVKDATEVHIDPQVGPVSVAGAIEVKPSQSTTYTLTARGAGGQGTASLSIAVTPKAPAAKPVDSSNALYESGLAERRAGHTAKAMAVFRQAAELGDVRAMLEVAEEGLDNDNGDSERWFRKAAELGDPTAMLNMGAMYQLGNHVKEDYAQAASWYKLAADKGNSSAMYNLGRMYERGNGVAKNLAKAKELYQKAASKGNSDARTRLDLLTDK